MSAELRAEVDAALAESATPGCAVAVSCAGRTEVVCSGLANVETGAPFTAETRMPIASVTKTFTATAVMSLVDAGRIELDAPVRRYLPEFRVADPDASERTTIRHLLNHTAGWVGDPRDEDRDSFDRGDGAVASEVAKMANLAQVTPVGSAWSYSNNGMVLAGRVVEALCGTTYEAAMERLVLTPLNLSRSTFFVELAIGYPTVVGHEGTGQHDYEVIRWPWACERRIQPAGGLISSVADQLTWARWWAGDLDDKDVRAPLGTPTRRRMLTEQVPAGNICDTMGLGWMIDDVDGAQVVHHGGTLYGLQTLVLFVPAARLSLVVLANARGGLLLQRRLRDYVLERYAGIRSPSPLGRASQEPAPAKLDDYAGRYVKPAPDRHDIIEVRQSEPALDVLLPGDGPGSSATTVRTVPIGDDTVLVQGGPLSGMRGEFLRDADGAVVAFRFGGRVCPRDSAAAASPSA